MRSKLFATVCSFFVCYWSSHYTLWPVHRAALLMLLTGFCCVCLCVFHLFYCHCRSGHFSIFISLFAKKGSHWPFFAEREKNKKKKTLHSFIYIQGQCEWVNALFDFRRVLHSHWLGRILTFVHLRHLTRLVCLIPKLINICKQYFAIHFKCFYRLFVCSHVSALRLMWHSGVRLYGLTLFPQLRTRKYILYYCLQRPVHPLKRVTIFFLVISPSLFPNGT